MRIFLDTNIFLAILNEEDNWHLAEKILLDIHNGKHAGYTSVICVSEILSGFYAESSVFTGRASRQAALKAANRIGGTKDKAVEIRLRERGAKKVHIFMGWKELVNAPKNKPAWMPDKINKPFVKKVGTEKLAKL